MGKASKRRHCPVLRGDITPADCGEHRHSRHACPVDCPFNPFAPAQYDLLLGLEDGLDRASFAALHRESPGAVARIDAAGRANPDHGLHAGVVQQLFFERDDGGRVFAERWEAAGLSGLRNDARVLFRGKARMRVALLEFHRVLDDRQLEAVDLLDPATGPIRLVDRSSAARMARFITVLTWVYPLPHFWRMSGTGIVLPDFGATTGREAILEIIRHLGGPVETGAERALWLARNFCRVDEAIKAVADARHHLMLSAVDAQFGAATYALEGGFRESLARLSRHDDVADDTLSAEETGEGFSHAKVWFDTPRPGAVHLPGGARPGLGRVLLGPKVWRVEAIGAARLARLRQIFEQRLGARVRFTHERRDDLARRLDLARPEPDHALVPPRLLEQVDEFELSSSTLPAPPAGVSLEEYGARLKHDFRQALLSAPLPALGGLTPGEAAADPARRPALIEIMKRHVRDLDEDNLRSGRDDDINALLRELGLHEIDFPPPPPRARLRDEEDEEEDDDVDQAGEEEPDRLAPDLSRRPAPPLFDPPLLPEEASRRLESSMAEIGAASVALEELDLSGATLEDDLSVLAEDMLTDEEYDLLFPLALQAWFALVPKGVRAPRLRVVAMQDSVVRGAGQLRASRSAGFESLVNASRQPGLLCALVEGLTQFISRQPENRRPTPQGFVGVLLILSALVDELDQARRAGR